MNILAFDTCFARCSVAAGRDLGTSVARIEGLSEERLTGHAERLLPMIEAALGGAGLRVRDLDRVAVTTGPGTFTGTRTGVAAARALALASGLPVVGTTSLAVMAEEAFGVMEDRERGLILVAVDARRGGLYAQLFGAGGRDPKSPPLLVCPQEAARLGGGAPVVAVGSGAGAVRDAAEAQGRQVLVRMGDIEPDARSLLHMALRLTPLTVPVVPLYLRPADAKPRDGAAVARL